MDWARDRSFSLLLQTSGNSGMLRVMSRSRLLLAWTLVTLQFPGTLEVIENVAHFVNHGHLSILEATGHHHHTPESEGGCTTESHSHGPNLAPLFPMVGRIPDLRPAFGGRLARIAFEARGPQDGHLPSLFRPPIVTA